MLGTATSIYFKPRKKGPLSGHKRLNYSAQKKLSPGQRNRYRTNRRIIMGRRVLIGSAVGLGAAGVYGYRVGADMKSYSAKLMADSAKMRAEAHRTWSNIANGNYRPSRTSPGVRVTGIHVNRPKAIGTRSGPLRVNRKGNFTKTSLARSAYRRRTRRDYKGRFAGSY